MKPIYQLPNQAVLLWPTNHDGNELLKPQNRQFVDKPWIIHQLPIAIDYCHLDSIIKYRSGYRKYAMSQNIYLARVPWRSPTCPMASRQFATGKFHGVSILNKVFHAFSFLLLCIPKFSSLLLPYGQGYNLCPSAFQRKHSGGCQAIKNRGWK